MKLPLKSKYYRLIINCMFKNNGELEDKLHPIFFLSLSHFLVVGILIIGIERKIFGMDIIAPFIAQSETMICLALLADFAITFFLTYILFYDKKEWIKIKEEYKHIEITKKHKLLCNAYLALFPAFSCCIIFYVIPFILSI